MSARLGAAFDRLKSNIRDLLGRSAADESYTLREVMAGELRAIIARRRLMGLDSPGPDLDRATQYAPESAWKAGLVGLCFSGGGIRSAAFNLGILQRLAGHRLIGQCDYLSTVSGGGYIGSWFTALLHRTFTGERAAYSPDQDQFEKEFRDRFDEFEARLAWFPGDAGSDRAGDRSEHPAIGFLRQYSNYLTPKLGAFSADTWSLIATYIRNAALNQLVLILFLSAVLLAPRALSTSVAAIESLDLATGRGTAWFAVTLLVGLAAAAGVAWRLGRNLAGTDATDNEPEPDSTERVLRKMLLRMFVIGLVVASVAVRVPGDAAGSGSAWATAAAAGAVANLAVWGIAGLAARWSPWGRKATARSWKMLLFSAILAGALLGLLLFAVVLVVGRVDYTGFRVLLAPPLVIAALLICAIVHTGIAGDDLDWHGREWLSRLGGLMGIAAIGWTVAAGLVFLSPLLIDLLPFYVDWPLVAGWLATTFGGVYAGRTTGAGESVGAAKKLLMVAAPWIFIGGLLVLLSAGVQGALHFASGRFESLGDGASDSYAAYSAALQYWGEVPWEPYGRWLAATESLLVLVAAIVVAVLSMLGLSRRVGINSFSLHSMYANRLVRCFLGAANAARNRNRRENPFTRFSSTDDLGLGAFEAAGGRLLGLREGNEPVDPVPAASVAAYPGPYQIVNTAINLASSDNLAWQERKAGSFILSPLYCGYALPVVRAGGAPAADERTFRPSGRFASSPRRLTLGDAVATSGAAASPNMGYHTTPALAFLLGIFNIRLGRWVPNTRKRGDSVDSIWRQSGPAFALGYLLCEVFGLTSDRSRFVYLSDGGHFDNLGIYEMVRRNCRFVIACDSGADPGYDFEDLGNAIRKCRIDLGVEIQIDVRQIARRDEDACNSAPCAVGKIRYPDGRTGVLLYIKSSRRPGMPSDVLQYARKSPAFPHESTADQFFSESQFESYRRLGHFIASEIFANPMKDVRSREPVEAAHRGIDMEQLFYRLEQAWHPPSTAVSAHFSTLTTQIDNVFERLRVSDKLDFLSEQFYPEWRTLMSGDPEAPAPHSAATWELPTDEERLREGFYFCNSLIQLMESVYLDLELESAWNHPDNSGWINVFRHWTWSTMFRLTWTISAATYGRRFREFCRRHLQMKLGDVEAKCVYQGSPGSIEGLKSTLEEARLNLVERDQIGKLVDEHTHGRDIRVYRLDLQVERTGAAEDDPPADRLLRSFAFGYGVVAGNELVMYRVQDHVRSMELGRRGLVRLVAIEERRGNGLALSDRAEALLRLVGEPSSPVIVAEFEATLGSVQAAIRSRAGT